MADGDKTAALVVALSAQLTKFEKDMKQAGDIADKTVSGIEDRFSKANPVFSGAFLGTFLSNLSTKALEAAIKFASDLVDRFIELEKTSHLVGESMRDLFGAQEAAKQFKVPVEDTLASLKSLAVLLDQMQRGEKNTLSKLFEANPEALRGVNRDALTLQQTFAIVADLVQNARTEIQKIDLAKAAGQSESMVPFLERGGKAVTEISKAAAAAAPDLQKIADSAKAFDEAWKTAVTNVKGYLSEHLFDIIKTDLADFIDILGGLVKFLSLFKGGLFDPTASIAQLEKLKFALINFQSSRNFVDESAGLNLNKPTPPGPRQAGTGTRDTGRGLSNVPLTPETAATRDEFDRAVERITRHTATVNADTQAVFANNAVQAQLRAEFQLLNAARLANKDITDAQIETYQRLRSQGLEPLAALTAAHIALTDRQSQALINASERAKIATANFDAAKFRLEQINTLSSTLGSALSSAFADAIVEGKKLNEVFSSLVKTLEKAAINSIFNSFFTPQGGQALSTFGSLLPRFAGGTDYAPGGFAWVGESGKELVNLPRGSQVIPNEVASRAGTGGGGGGGVVQIHLSLAGANGDETIRKIAYAATAQGMRQALAQVPRLAVGAVAQYQSRSG